MKTFIPRARAHKIKNWFGIELSDVIATIPFVAVFSSILPQELKIVSFLLFPLGILLFSQIRTKTRDRFLWDLLVYIFSKKRVIYENIKSHRKN
jgi:hypothetical protein